MFFEVERFKCPGLIKRMSQGHELDVVLEVPRSSQKCSKSKVIFFLTSIGITVILMNIFIAVLGQNLELFQDQAQQLFARARAKMLLGQHQHPWARLWRFCCARIRRRTRDDAKSLKDPFQRCSCLRYVLYRSLWPLSILAGEQAIFRSLWSECLRRPRTAYVLLFFCPMTFFLCLACLIPFGCCCLVFRKQGLQFWFRILFLGIYCGLEYVLASLAGSDCISQKESHNIPFHPDHLHMYMWREKPKIDGMVGRTFGGNQELVIPKHSVYGI